MIDQSMFRITRWDVICPLCGVVSSHDDKDDALYVQDEHDNFVGHDCVIAPIPVIADSSSVRVELVLFDGEHVSGGGV